MKRGFTLAELIIVVVIIAVLVGISIPILSVSLEKSRNAVDMSTMRQAKSVLSIEAITTSSIIMDGNTRYYYNPTTGQISTEKPTHGYGKSHTDASKWWIGIDQAVGTPSLNGSAAVLALTINQDKVIKYYWGGAYTGQNTLSQSEYQQMTEAQKIEKDKLLLDSLQNEFRNMTYSQLRDLFLPNGSKRSDLTYGTLNNNLCVVIAFSKISNDGVVNTSNSSNNQIYIEDIFSDVGFNTSLDPSQTYIINSVSDKQQTIWVNLGIKESELRNLSDEKASQTASKSYTYLKSGGGVTPTVLQETYRKNM